jgi:cell surface protein SprA
LASVNSSGFSNNSINILTFPNDTTLHQRTDTSLVKDSLKIKSDSALSKIDTTLRAKVLFLDSTARIEQFHFQRSDPVYTPLNLHKRSKFFAYPSSSLQSRTVELDSTGNYVLIKEKTAGEETKVLLRIPLEEYIQLRLKANNRNLWEALFYKYELKQSEKDLGQLITDITNIDIPLPSVGFLSIFGPPVINLRIGGAVDIHGAWRSETTEGVTASLLGNTRNEPDFKQQVQINVNGTIGDKLTIGADWNTERTFEYENQLKLKYKGYPDEIVQSVEAGNVSLQTSSLVGGSDALFGVKAQFQMGPLTLTTLASQKKGEVKEVSISGGSTSQDFSLHAYQYSKNHFFVDTIYASTNPKYNFFYKYYGNANPEIIQNYTIKEIDVWKSKSGLRDIGTERQVNAYIDLPSTTANNPSFYDNLRGDVTEQKGKIIHDRFTKLTQGVDYNLHAETGYITFTTQIQESDAIAVAYRIEGPTSESSDDLYYGELISDQTTADTSKTLVLKLVKPKNLGPEEKEAWQLQLKNIYPIGGRSINEEGFELDIQYVAPGQEPVNQLNGTPLLNAFGLDLYSEGGLQQRDGKFDFRKEKTIFATSGEIIFPVLQPFGKNLPSALPDSLKFNAVYDTTTTFAQNQANKDRLLIVGKYSAASSSVFNLGFTGIVENSVKVRLGGMDLKEGTDFVVDYNIGQVTIKNAAALVPGADLKISYEQNDLFSLASKTLLGMRGEFNFSPKTVLGFSALNLNQQTLSDKVRIGEEPLNNSIYGVDFKTSVDLPFLTKGISHIIPTKTMSSFSVQGEFAYINPDPNTKKSTISSDQSKSIAYIDDFEGSKKTIPIGLSYTSWHDLSTPNAKATYPYNSISDSAKTVQMYYKGKSWWYTRIPSDVSVKDIWGDRKKVATSDEQVTVMDYVFDPKQKGPYNYKPRLSDPTKEWGGIMKLLSSTANNLVEENIEFIEFWINLNSSKYNGYNLPTHQAPPTAKLYLDLGKISEDVIPNGKLDTEDKNENSLIDEGEDIGIDGMNDTQERQKYNTDETDPSGDDYQFNLAGNNTDYSKINGTEGNAVSIDAGRFPDTEDLNNNLSLDQLDSYFRYEIPLDTSRTSNPYITSGQNKAGWYQFRIPLKDFKAEIGSPSFSNVDMIRLWVAGVSEPIHIRLTEFNLSGNQWQKVVSSTNTEDSTLTLSVANYEDNYPTYYLPPGVSQERDRSNPNEEVFRNEQSLSLIIKDLKDGEERQVVKYLRALDVFNYKEMKLFIHGDKRIEYNVALHTANANDVPYITVNKDSIAGEFYFRFGSDTTNYYEYSLPLENRWMDISIKFDELTALKQLRGNNTTGTFQFEVSGNPGHYYRIRGNPSLTKISFFMAGVSNPKGRGITEPISGDVWVNELRVIGADDQSGWAYSASGKLNIADVMSVNFNTSQTNPNFHKLADRFGSRLDSRNWGVNVDLDVLKLLPVNLPGSNLKVNYARTEQLSTPVYQPGTDVKVETAAQQMAAKGVSTASIDSFKQATRTVSTSETWTVAGFRIKVPSSLWFFNYFVNNLQWGFNYNKTFGRSPSTQTQKAWNWNANMSYAVNLSQNNFFYPADIPLFGTIIDLFSDYKNTKVYFVPQNFTWNLTATRNYNYNLQRGLNVKPLISKDFKSTRSFSFQWKLTEGGFLNLGLNYSFNFSSSLAHLVNDSLLSEGQIWRAIFTKDYFGKDYQFQQNMDLKSSPKLPALWDINKYFTINWGYGSSYTWQNNLEQEVLGRAAGFGNKVNASVTIKLKSLVAPLFKEEEQNPSSLKQPDNRVKEKAPSNEPRSRQNRDRQRLEQVPNEQIKTNADSLTKRNIFPENDSLLTQNKKLNDSLKTGKGSIDSVGTPSASKFKVAWQLLKSSIRWLLFDYESIQFSFSNDNTVQKTGIQGTGSGIANFWGLTQNNDAGPSRAFMLGFSSDVGARAYDKHSAGSNLSDNFSQRNSIDLKTSRPLWEGASLELKWRVGWQVSKSSTIVMDSLGQSSITNPSSTGSITRSFVSLPSIPLLSFIKGGIKRVNELFDPQKGNLSEAFLNGFESIPLISKLPFLQNFTKFVPRPNWSINWDGIEKYSLFKSWAKRVSLDHAYTSEYTEGWKIDPDGQQITQSQKVNYGFSPLVGINITFNSLWNGDLTANIKYNTKTGYDLGVSTQNITESFSKDIGVTASYSKRGFEIPLFGVSLKNDIEISFSYTTSTSTSVVYNMGDSFTEQGTPQDGTTRTTLEPRIKYTISSKVTLSIFYKRSSTSPQGAARITPVTTNEAGLDVHISIQ